MRSQNGGPEPMVFHVDGRGTWRATWTLAYAFLMVAWLMQREGGGGGGPWLLFAGLAVALATLGISALLAPRRRLLAVEDEGLHLYAGAVGLGGTGEAGSHRIPWSAIERVAFERRHAAHHRGDGPPPMVTALCFRLRPGAGRPDGQRGFVERVVDRESELAVGEHFLWRPSEGTLDLMGHPRGGLSRLTAEIARRAPRLGDASGTRRRGIGGTWAHAAYDTGLAAVLIGTVLIWATGHMEVYVEAGRRLMEWGARVPFL